MGNHPIPENAPLVLIIRDGWGENPNREHDDFNAIRLAATPCAESLDRDWPRTLIHTSGEDVGLPVGTMGNSEVGHQNIGAGRIVDQDAVRISRVARAGTFHEIKPLVRAIEAAESRGGAVHLMGLCSDAGVHALTEHINACLDLCKDCGAKRVYLHCFTDGRDMGPFAGAALLEGLESHAAASGARIASVMGRYWPMDRDNRWERVARAYACLTGRDTGVLGVRSGASAIDVVRDFYESPESPNMRGDEFIAPTMIGDSAESIASSRIRDGDSVIFFNFRGDRPRELVRAFVLPEFFGAAPPSPDTGARGFDRGDRLDLTFVAMTSYAEDILPYVDVAFPKPPRLANIGGECLSTLGLTQFRCAETEKFPHVTFFFNDYRDKPFDGESREIIQSPRVSTYDQQPEMSAQGVCDAVLRRLAADDCESMIVVNFANPDMVGHTGSLEAAIKACEVVDGCVSRVLEAALGRGGSAIVTADHGNAEQMWDPKSDCPHTAHTTYDVPLYVVGEPFRGRALRSDGRLADIFPTCLSMLGIETPREMTGQSLLA